MSEQTARQRTGSGCAVTLLIGLFIFALGVLIVLASFGKLHSETDIRIKAIHDAGEPASLAELNAFAGNPPDADNAAMSLEKAFDSFVDLNLKNSSIPYAQSIPGPTEPLSSDAKSATAAYLAQVTPCFPIVEEALQKSACRFPVNYLQGANISLPHLAKLRGLARALTLKATYEADSGNADTATKALLDEIRLSESLHREPLLISQLVRVAMHGLVVSGLEQSLNRTHLTPEQLKQLQHEIEKANTHDGLYYGLIGERCMLIDEMSGGGSWSTPPSAMSPYPTRAPQLGAWRWRNQIDLRQAVGMLDRMVAASRKSSSEMDAEFSAIQREYDEQDKSTIRWFLHVFSQLLVPPLLRAGDSQLRDTSQLNCAIAALAALRYKNDKGMLPDSLVALVPHYLKEVPIDPIDSKPLGYVHSTDGFTVYSIGPDHIDDGGKPPAEGKSIQTSGDLTFTVRLRPK